MTDQCTPLKVHGFNKKRICRCEERSAKLRFALRQSNPLIGNGIASSGKERRIRNDNCDFVKALAESIGQLHHGSMYLENRRICHPEPPFFGSEGSSETQPQGFFRLAFFATVDLHLGIERSFASLRMTFHSLYVTVLRGDCLFSWTQIRELCWPEKQSSLSQTCAFRAKSQSQPH
jgi:hypothetical protein